MVCLSVCLFVQVARRRRREEYKREERRRRIASADGVFDFSCCVDFTKQKQQQQLKREKVKGEGEVEAEKNHVLGWKNFSFFSILSLRLRLYVCPDTFFYLYYYKRTPRNETTVAKK